ncbi:MAG: DedA family protein [Candidatus Liptonbacteria bacterium]|nr:DedA family protein [Candidatus Liptonbacteria bacterium]
MLNIPTLIETAGYLGIFTVVFAESGVLLGFFLPGDTLLFTAGILAYKGLLNYWLLLGLIFGAAVLGDSVGYMIGRKVGPAIFKKEDSFLFHKDHILRAEKFYERHGGKTIILARFMPLVRTLAPILAGVGRMRYLSFVFYNLFGGALWTFGLVTIGFYLGRVIPNIEAYVWPIVALMILGSISPTLVTLIRNERYRKHIKEHLREFYKKVFSKKNKPE